MNNILSAVMDGGWLGLESGVWTVIAIVAAAVFVFLIIVTILVAHRRHTNRLRMEFAHERLGMLEVAATTEDEIAEDAEEESGQTEEEALAEDAEDEAAEVETDEIIDGAAIVPKKLSPNFRMRLKESSDRNRLSYVEITNKFMSYRGISYTMTKRQQRFKYDGGIIARIGVASRHVKLYLALDPASIDAEEYTFKDVSDKKAYAETPVMFRIGSERALRRYMPFVERLLEEKGAEAKKKYADKGLQELAYTLRRNALLRLKKKELLRETIHSHDAQVLLTDVETEKLLERKDAVIPLPEHFAMVSITSINDKFMDGQRVNLAKLKKAELVAEECNGYWVTGGGALTRPLIIEANNFSDTAIKMIALTGGRAIMLVRKELTETTDEHEQRVQHERETLSHLTRESVTVTEAQEALSDETAITIYESDSEPAAETAETETLLKKIRMKKAEINVDTLNANFGSYETVTLEKLKEKKLVSRKSMAVKVLARGRLEKPLFVEAQDFSVDAIKMILLCGGKAKRVNRK